VKEKIGNLISLPKLSPTKVIAPAERYHPSPGQKALELEIFERKLRKLPYQNAFPIRG
jgi:hypothetical protein